MNIEVVELLAKANKIISVTGNGPGTKYPKSLKKIVVSLAKDHNISSKEIIKHIHPPQQRNTKTTSEVLIVLKGQIEYEIYDEELEFCESGIVESGNMLVLINGGHGLKMLEDAKFIEVKQGPYDESIDKVRF